MKCLPRSSTELTNSRPFGFRSNKLYRRSARGKGGETQWGRGRERERESGRSKQKERDWVRGRERGGWAPFIYRGLRLPSRSFVLKTFLPAVLQDYLRTWHFEERTNWLVCPRSLTDGATAVLTRRGENLTRTHFSTLAWCDPYREINFSTIKKKKKKNRIRVTIQTLNYLFFLIDITCDFRRIPEIICRGWPYRCAWRKSQTDGLHSATTAPMGMDGDGCVLQFS